MKFAILALMMFAIINSQCGDGCSRCSNKVCTVCDLKTGYYIQNGKCELVNQENGCMLHNDLKICLMCKNEYHLDNTTKTCILVQGTNIVPNCLKYHGNKVCAVCQPGFFLDQSNCTIIANPIPNCNQENNNQQCITCAKGFLVSPDKKSCVTMSDISNCSTQSNISCRACNSVNYFLNQNNYIYQMFNLQTIFQRSNIVLLQDQIDQGFVDVTKYNSCQQHQVNNCAEYKNFDQCQKCVEGYYFDEKTDSCVLYPLASISKCDVYVNQTTCKQCVEGYYIDNNVCTKVTEVENCEIYNKETGQRNCIQCKREYFLIGFNNCVERKNMISNCEEHDSFKEECLICKNTFVLTNDKLKCLPQVSKCEYYEPSNVFTTELVCHSCENEYFYDLNSKFCSNGSKNNCVNYKRTEDVCILCKNDHYLESGSCQAHNQILDCKQYHKTVKNVCIECNNSSVLFWKENECKEVTTIEFCTRYNQLGECQTCNDGYEIDGGSCILITEPQNCLQKLKSKCVKCLEDFILDDGVCKDSLDYIVNQCESDNIDGTVGYELQQCNYCKLNSVPYNFKDTYICLEENYIKLRSGKQSLDEACLSYTMDMNQSLVCQRCKFPKVLDDGACVDTCQVTKTLYKQILTPHFKNGSRSASAYSVESTNICKEKIPGCLISATDIYQPYQSSINYSCIECESSFIPKINFGLSGVMSQSNGNSENQFGKSPLSFHPGFECVPSNLISIHVLGNVPQDSDNKQVPNCHYYSDLGRALGCQKCLHGYHGVSLNTVNACDVYVDNIYTCKICQENYYLSSPYECKQVQEVTNCFKYSNTANTTKCIQCGDNFYVLNDLECANRENSLGINFCTLVLDSDDCTCDSEYFNIGQGTKECVEKPNFCLVAEKVQDNIICIECDSNTSFMDPNSNLCQFGNISNCFEYFPTEQKCKTCDNGYFVQNGNCLQHVTLPNCDQYDGENQNACKQCDNLSVLMTYKTYCRATQKIEFCTEYESISNCIECDSTLNKKLDRIGTSCTDISESLNCSILLPIDILNSGPETFNYLDINSDDEFYYTCDVCKSGFFQRAQNFIFNQNQQVEILQETIEHPMNGELIIDKQNVCVSNLVQFIGNCVDHTVTGSTVVTDGAKCNKCETNFFPENFAKNRYICLEYDYLYNKQESLKPNDQNTNCKRYDYIEITEYGQNVQQFEYICKECKYPYTLENEQYPKKCVPCPQDKTLYINNYIINSTSLNRENNTCVDKIPGVEVITNSFNAIVDIHLSCSDATMSVIAYDEYLIVPTNPDIGQTTWDNITQSFPQKNCVLKSSVNTLNILGIFRVGNEQIIANCEYYQEIATPIYGCVKCMPGYHGTVLDETGYNFINECVQMMSCDMNSPLNQISTISRGLLFNTSNNLVDHLYKFYSCFKCTGDGEIPVAFIGIDNLTGKVISLKQFYPNRETASETMSQTVTGNLGDKGKSIDCLKIYTDNTHVTEEDPININLVFEDNRVPLDPLQDNYYFPPHCALAMVNTESTAELDDIYTDNLSAATLFCTACDPGYRPIYADILTYKVIECRAQSCSGNSQNTLNTCDNCVRLYDITIADVQNRLKLEECVENQPVNCFAAYLVGQCQICNRGYNKVDGVCTEIQAPNCKLNYDLNYFEVVGNTQYDVNVLNLNLATRYFFETEQYQGCISCDGDSLVLTRLNDVSNGIVQNDENFTSEYLCTNSKNLNPEYFTVDNCQNYGFEEDGSIKCLQCDNDTVITQDFLCTQKDNLNNCNLANKMGGTTCIECKPTFQNVAGVCYVQSDELPISKCKTYDDQPPFPQKTSSAPICLTCIDNYYIKDGLCKQIPIDFCATWDETDCLTCIKNYALVDLKDNQIICIPIYQDKHNIYCVEFFEGKCIQCFQDNQIEQNGEIVKCTGFTADDQGCLTTGPAGCTMCKVGYTMNTQDQPNYCLENIDNDNQNQCEEWDPVAFQKKELRCTRCKLEYLLDVQIDTNLVRKTNCLHFFELTNPVDFEKCEDFDIRTPNPNTDDNKLFIDNTFRCLKCKTDMGLDPYLTYYYDSNSSSCIARTIDTNCAQHHQFKNLCQVCKDNYIFNEETNICDSIKTLLRQVNPDIDPEVPKNMGYIQSCNQFSSCQNNEIYEGLSVQLSSVLSCHVCSNVNQIPFVAIRYDFENQKIQSVQKWNIGATDKMFFEQEGGKSVDCYQNSSDTFGLQNNQYSVDQNCGVGIILTSFLPDSTSSNLDFNDGTDLSTQQIGVNCGACKPSYYATYTKVGQMNVKNMIKSCTSIDNCDSSSWFNNCSKCQPNFVYGYIKGVGVQYQSCNSLVGNPNCYAVDENDNCIYCKKGHLMNEDGYCEVFNPPRCGINNQTNNFRYRNQYNKEDLNTGLILSAEGVGCFECDSQFRGVYQNDDNMVCTESLYHFNQQVTAQSNFSQNCKYYKVVDKEQFFCQKCQTGFVKSVEGKCLSSATLSNCLEALTSDQCNQCNDGFINVNRVCVAGSVTNCLKYGHGSQITEQICLQCQNTFYLENNTCSQGNILNCVIYQGNQECYECDMGFELAHTKTGDYCFPNDYTKTFCKNLDYQFFIYGQFKCEECVSNNFVVQNIDYASICMRLRKTDNCLEYDKQSSIFNSEYNCQQCEETHYITGNDCVLRTVNPEHCEEKFNDQDKCKECRDNYYVSVDGTKCISNPEGIPNCSIYESIDKCTQCTNTHYLEDNKCQKLEAGDLDPNCAVYQDKGICKTCNANFLNIDGLCLQAIAQNCDTYESIVSCSTCTGDLGLIPTEQNVINCGEKQITNCLESDDFQPFTCHVCSGTNYPNNGECSPVPTPIEGCEQYLTESICGKCNPGFALTFAGDKCENSTEIVSLLDPNCTDSLISENPVCNTCSRGYFFSFGICVKCIDMTLEMGCQQCNPQDQSLCVLCSSTYYMYDDGKCYKNGTLPPSIDDNSNSGGDGNGGDNEEPNVNDGNVKHAYLRNVFLTIVLSLLHLV